MCSMGVASMLTRVSLLAVVVLCLSNSLYNRMVYLQLKKLRLIDLALNLNIDYTAFLILSSSTLFYLSIEMSRLSWLGSQYKTTGFV